MLSPEVLAPHPTAIPSPGGPLRAWLGGPSPTPIQPPFVGSEVRGESWLYVGNVLCWEERKDFRLPHFLPGTYSNWLIWAPGVSGTEKHRRGAGVSYSFDLLDQFLFQTWTCLALEGGRADWLRLRGSRETPFRMMGEDCVCTCLCSCAYVNKCVWCLYMCVAT